MKYHKLFYNPNARPMTTKKQFDDSFKAKYGKTYIEAEADMAEVMRPRVLRILEITKLWDLTLLDFGTAYGAFLSCLPPDWIGYGIEKIPAIAKKAQDMGRKVYSCDGKSDINKLIGGVHVFTAWNVIEHLDNLGEFFDIAGLFLRPDGLLCISTPNSAGGTFRFRRDEYERADAGDHYWHFTPKSLKRLLEAEGYEVVKTVITGHHPSRWGGAMFLSKLLRLGDTFETYARRRI